MIKDHADFEYLQVRTFSPSVILVDLLDGLNTSDYRGKRPFSFRDWRYLRQWTSSPRPWTDRRVNKFTLSWSLVDTIIWCFMQFSPCSLYPSGQYLSMLFLSFYQCITPFSFQATDCFPTELFLNSGQQYEFYQNEYVFNSLANSKVSDVINLKAFADHKLNIARMMISLFDREDNAGCQHFLLFPQCFPKPSLGSLKVWIVW